MRKTLLGIAAAAALSVPLLGAVAPTYAADGEEYIVNGDFSDVGPGGSLVGATTDFALTTSLNQAYTPGTGDMYDPGVYAVASNPNSLHQAWAVFPEGDPQLIANGFERTAQTVWQQDITPQTCTTPGSQLTFDFSATATNILPLSAASDGGANISVYVNDTLVGQQDLTGVDPSNPVTFNDAAIPWAATMTVKIVNDGTVYAGNDFAIDDISLIQRGGCTVAAPVVYDVAPTAPSCDADGFLDTSVFPIVRASYFLTVDRQYTGPGVYTITAHAHEGFYIPEGLETFTVTVLPKRTNCCIPSVTEHQWYNWTGGPVTSAPAPNDPKWHAVSGDPRSDLHKWENHPSNVPYQAGKPGKADWFKWVTTPGTVCSSAR